MLTGNQTDLNQISQVAVYFFSQLSLQTLLFDQTTSENDCEKSASCLIPQSFGQFYLVFLSNSHQMEVRRQRDMEGDVSKFPGEKLLMD